MRWVCRDDLGHGENPDFLAFHLFADDENHELPCQFLRPASLYFSASERLFSHGFRPRVYESALNHGQDHVCCEMLRPPNMYPLDRGFMDG